MRGARWGIGMTALICALVFAAGASAADSVYWTNDSGGSLGVAALDGSGASTILPTPVGAEQPYGTAVDSAAGKVYWADGLSDTIKFADLDGSESGTLDTGSAEVNVPEGIAIDPAGGRVYWANSAGDSIGWAALDDSGESGLLDTTDAPIEEPAGVVVDPAEGRIYWASYEDSLIGWASLDGLGSGELQVAEENFLEGPDGLAIDPTTERIYWANWDTGTIGWSTLDGDVGGLKALGGLAEPEGAAGIAIDPEAGELYWANENGFVASLSLSGGTTRELDIAGASPAEPSFPVLLKKPVARPVPAVVTTVEVGTTLTCPTGGAFESDLVESFLYRAPERETISWTLNGAALNGATSPKLIATQPGSYTCWVTGTNGAGSTTAGVKSISVTGTPATTTPISVSLRPVTKLQVLKLKYDKGHGTATLLAKVSGPGRLYLYGKQVARRSVRSSGAGIAKLKIAATGKALKTLRATGKAKLEIKLKFVTSEGGVASTSRSLTLRLKK